MRAREQSAEAVVAKRAGKAGRSEGPKEQDSAINRATPAAVAGSPPKPAGSGNCGRFPAGRKARAGVDSPERTARGGQATGRANHGSETRTTMRETGNPEPVTLESVLAKENLNAAWSQVKANDGAAGVDGLEVERSLRRIREGWTKIAAALLAGPYQPAAVRAVTIPKANGGERTLGIPTVCSNCT